LVIITLATREKISTQLRLGLGIYFLFGGQPYDDNIRSKQATDLK
jgi:hypothetical protein